MVHPRLSENTAEELYARGRELRAMARSARLAVDTRALQVLADRFERLAASRGQVERESCYPPCPEMPAGEDFAEAWQMACRHISKRYVHPETMRHPEVISECYHLACMIVAYGLTSQKTILPNSAEARPPAAEAIDTSRAAGHRVLVVDDVPDVLVSTGAFLVNAGFTVRKASNGDEALRVIASDPLIDVLVTDFAMPGLNGADLISQATQMRPSLKALVITAYPNADGLGDLPAGTTILSKPFRRDALVAAVNSLFTEHDTAREPVTKLRQTVSGEYLESLNRER